MLRILLLCSLVVGCAPAMVVQEREVDGIAFALYLDAPDNEFCGRLKFNEGCTVTPLGGKPRVYVSSVAPAWVLTHEIEHVRGMRHSDWKSTPNGFCCVVYYAGASKKYARGDTLCNVGGTEHVIRP